MQGLDRKGTETEAQLLMLFLFNFFLWKPVIMRKISIRIMCYIRESGGIKAIG